MRTEGKAKNPFDLSQGPQRSQRVKIFPCPTIDCLPCPYGGVQSRKAGLNMGKVLKGKKNAFFFP